MKKLILSIAILLIFSITIQAQFESIKDTTEIKSKAKKEDATQATGEEIRILDEDSNELLKVIDEGNFGSLELKSGVPSSTTDKLYNNSGTLNFNGTVLGSGASVINDLGDAKYNGWSLFLGEGAGSNDSEINNVSLAIGKNALFLNSTGDYNLAIGHFALSQNTSGIANTAIGYNSLTSCSSSYNTAYGFNTLFYNTTGNTNTAIGYYSMYNSIIASSNTALGAQSFYSNEQGNENVVIGANSEYYNEFGQRNTILGCQAGMGSFLHSKSDNIFIGYRAGKNETGSNLLYIENTESSSPLIWGDFTNDYATINGKLGISTKTPTSKIDIEGSSGFDQLRLRDPYTPTSSKDSNGELGDITWDESFFYVKTRAGWKRAALSAF